jgi:hypothetical protein
MNVSSLMKFLIFEPIQSPSHRRRPVSCAVVRLDSGFCRNDGLTFIADQDKELVCATG